MSSLVGTLGLANRARKVEAGDQVIKSIQSKKAYFVVIDETIGENMKKKLLDKCDFYNVEYAFVPHSVFQEVFGLKNFKSVSITDKGFAKTIQSCMKG